METNTKEIKKEWLTAIHDVEKQMKQEAVYFRKLLSIYLNQLDKTSRQN